MQKKYLILFLLALILPSMISKAQEAWSLEQCIKYAFDNNIQIKQQLLNVKVNEGVLLQSKLNRLPSINASVDHSYNFDRAITFSKNAVVSGATLQSTNFSISSSISLFQGLQNYNTIKKNQLDLMATLSDVEKIKNSVALNVASAYLQILFSEELLSSSTRQLELSKMQVERTSVLVKAGSLPEGNLLEIEAQMASDELQVVNSQNQLDIANLNLTQLLDIKDPSNFKITKPNLENIEGKLLILTPGDVFQNALDAMPQIKGANYRVSSAERKLSIEKGGQIPNLSLRGSVGSGGDKIINNDTLVQQALVDQFKDNKYSSITFSLSIPIFNGWMVRNRISASKISLENAKLSLENEKNILFKDIQQAYTDALAAQKKYKATQKNLVALTEAFRYSEQKFTVGMVTSVDYTTAKTKLSKAETDLLQAKYELIFKSKILEFYKGIPLSL